MPAAASVLEPAAQRGVEVQTGLFEVNQNLEPISNPTVVARIGAPESNIASLWLRFLNMPFEIPFAKTGSTRWEARLTAEDLKDLAVGGRTMHYPAQVMIKNSEFEVIESGPKLVIAVKAPELSRPRARRR